jgi:hypothetical protein
MITLAEDAQGVHGFARERLGQADNAAVNSGGFASSI